MVQGITFRAAIRQVGCSALRVQSRFKIQGLGVRIWRRWSAWPVEKKLPLLDFVEPEA